MFFFSTVQLQLVARLHEQPDGVNINLSCAKTTSIVTEDNYSNKTYTTKQWKEIAEELGIDGKCILLFYYFLTTVSFSTVLFLLLMYCEYLCRLPVLINYSAACPLVDSRPIADYFAEVFIIKLWPMHLLFPNLYGLDHTRNGAFLRAFLLL